MPNDKSDLKQELQQQFARSLQELKTIRDEIRVKLHLAGMDAKQTWEELEPRLEQVERQIRDATDSAAEKMKDTLDELATSFKNLRNRL